MKYWYFENWTGRKIESDNLQSLKQQATLEDGISITIYATGGVACIVNANGYVAP